MSELKDVFHEKLAARVIEGLESRGIRSVYAKTREEACERIAKMVPPGAVVGLGGSVTLEESGLLVRLRGMNVQLLDRYAEGVAKEQIAEMRVRGLTSDVFISSVNAVTTNGILISEDGLGNRVASMIFGPRKVIIIAGVNKIVHSVADGLARIKQVCAPMNSLRFGADTPCARTGVCDDAGCRPPERICGQIGIVESCMTEDRIHVVLVGEALGF